MTISAALKPSAPPWPTTASVAMSYLRGTTVLPAALVRPERFGAIGRVLGAAAPGMAHADVALLCDVFLAIFAVDDLVDEGGLDEEEVARRMERYAGCAAGRCCPEIAADPIAACLGSIAERLRRAPAGAALFDEWARRAREFLGAMTEERRTGACVAAGGAPATLARYLETGRHSVGIALMSMAAWTLLGEVAPAGLPLLVEAERRLSLACRLANDLRTYERERQDGAINALSVVGPGGEPLLRRMQAAQLVAGRRLAARVPGARRSAAFLDGFASAVIDLYAERDFHTQAA